jgi:hypothetical protein
VARMPNLINIIIYWLVIVIFLGVCMLEAWLTLKKKLIVSVIMPVILFIAFFPSIIKLFKGVITASSVFPSAAAFIIIMVFIGCRVVVRFENLKRIKSDVRSMEISDIEE